MLWANFSRGTGSLGTNTQHCGVLSYFHPVLSKLAWKLRRISSPNRGLWFWTGAPCSPQRTWAENEFFKCFPPCATILALRRSLFARVAEALEGAAPRIFRPMDPDFLHGAPPTDACAAFIKESRMKFANASKLDRKSGVRSGEHGAPVLNHRPRLGDEIRRSRQANLYS